MAFLARIMNSEWRKITSKRYPACCINLTGFGLELIFVKFSGDFYPIKSRTEKRGHKPGAWQTNSFVEKSKVRRIRLQKSARQSLGSGNELRVKWNWHDSEFDGFFYHSKSNTTGDTTKITREKRRIITTASYDRNIGAKTKRYLNGTRDGLFCSFS